MKQRLRMWAALCALVALPACAGAGLFGRGQDDGSASAVQGYNFAYRIEDGGLGLVQVFDDGRNTYFQLRSLDLEHVPVLWTESSALERRAVALRASGPYLVANALERKFVLTLGEGRSAKEATVLMTDWQKRGLAARTARAKPLEQAARAVPVVASAPGTAQPEPTREAARPASSTECPGAPQGSASRTIDVPFVHEATEPTLQARKDLRSIAARLAGAARIVIRGRPSPGGGVAQARARAEAIKALLVKAGVPGPHIEVALAGTSKAGPVAGVYVSQIRYGAASSGFVVLDGC